MADKIEQNSGESFDFGKEMNSWGLESITALALDTRLGCLHEEKLSENLVMVDLVHRILEHGKSLDSGFRFWEVVPSASFREFCRLHKEFSLLTGNYIQEALHRTDSGKMRSSLLHQLAREGCDKKTISTMASDLMFGGVDNTSHACIFCLHLLATNPEEQEHLHTHLVSSSKREAETYLKAVVRESLRLQPPALGNIRQLADPLKLGRFQLEGGTNYILAHRHMSRSDRHVPLASSFLPSRWLRNSSHHHPIHPFVSLPWGFGPRMCIGRKVAELEMFTLLTAIITRFKVGWSGGELGVRSNTLLYPDGDLNFTFTKRS